jgi:phenylalanyl-tRNA synthetase beta chain
MKFSERWLREWIDPPLDSDALAAQLTGAGLEVDAVLPLAAASLDGVVLGQVLSAEPHPDADRLRLCSVDIGAADPVGIVCGAPNARAGLWAPVALPGARLPGGLKIRKSRIRGQESSGMLCSARELGMGEESDGLLELDGTSAAGTPLGEVLDLHDTIIDVDLTPNRGDCLCLEGIARDVAAVSGQRLQHRQVPAVPPQTEDTFGVRLDAPAACPRYVGRVIRGIDPAATTPLWMREKLRRCGVRSLSPVVDITNYVMLELGHPMHAFDLAALEGAIQVRHARDGEPVRLLDDSEQRLVAQDLVIADDAGAVALAGIMGGARTAVSDCTTDVFFECAWFEPRGIAVTARRLGLHTDASHRFERGVNPNGQMRAVERATALLRELAGGQAGPLVDTAVDAHLPRASPIRLRASRIRRLLGIEVAAQDVVQVLEDLHMAVTARHGARAVPEHGTAHAPAHRGRQRSTRAAAYAGCSRLSGGDYI